MLRHLHNRKHVFNRIGHFPYLAGLRACDNDAMSDGISKDVLARFAALRSVSESEEYIQTADPLDMFRRTLREFYDYSDVDMPVRIAGFTYMEAFLATTADIMSVSPDDGKHVVEAFIHDYPGVTGSNLAGRWSALSESCLAFKKAGSIPGNVVGLWESSKSLHLAFNEFMNGLLPFIVIGLKHAKGQKADLKWFKAVFKDKIDALDSLTGGLSGRAAPLIALPDRAIRNAIGHTDIFFDREAGVVRYGEHQGGNRSEHKMSIHDFMMRAAWYSHIPHAHLAAIAAISLLMNGTDKDKEAVRFALVNRSLPVNSF